MATKKNINYYMKLNWSYTIEQESVKGKSYYNIRVKELPGVCTDATTVKEGLKEIQEAIRAAVKLYMKNGESVPEPIKKENIAYRKISKCHYPVDKMTQKMHGSISKTLDELIDGGLHPSSLI